MGSTDELRFVSQAWDDLATSYLMPYPTSARQVVVALMNEDISKNPRSDSK